MGSKTFFEVDPKPITKWFLYNTQFYAYLIIIIICFTVGVIMARWVEVVREAPRVGNGHRVAWLWRHYDLGVITRVGEGLSVITAMFMTIIRDVISKKHVKTTLPKRGS